MANILIFDFETTGLLNNPDTELIEFAAIYKSGKDISETTFLIRPDKPISSFITNHTGISNEMVEEIGLSKEIAYDNIKEMFDLPVDMYITHNGTNFDIPLLEKEFSSIKLDRKKCFDTAGQFKGTLINYRKEPDESFYDFHKRILNTPRKGVFFNLKEATRHYQVQLSYNHTFHRALADCYAIYFVYKEQIKQIKANKI